MVIPVKGDALEEVAEPHAEVFYVGRDENATAFRLPMLYGTEKLLDGHREGTLEVQYEARKT